MCSKQYFDFCKETTGDCSHQQALHRGHDCSLLRGNAEKRGALLGNGFPPQYECKIARGSFLHIPFRELQGKRSFRHRLVVKKARSSSER